MRVGNGPEAAAQLEGKESNGRVEGLANVEEGSAPLMQPDTHPAGGLGEAEPSQPAECVHTEETHQAATAGKAVFAVEHGAVETRQEGGTVADEQEEEGSKKSIAHSSETAAEGSGDDCFESQSVEDERNPSGSTEREAVKLRSNDGQLRDEETTSELSKETGFVASRILEEATGVVLPVLEAFGNDEALGGKSSHGDPEVSELPSASTSVGLTADDETDSTMFPSRTVSMIDSEITGELYSC